MSKMTEGGPKSGLDLGYTGHRFVSLLSSTLHFIFFFGEENTKTLFSVGIIAFHSLKKGEHLDFKERSVKKKFCSYFDRYCSRL